MPKWTYVTRRRSRRRATRTSSSSTFNNWQRGDYKPYVVAQQRSRHAPGRTSRATCRRSTTCGRSRRITSTPNLLFAGTEFGLFFTVDGGRHWVQLKGGMPPTQVRDLQLQKRESDVVMATFGRGFWILDDYSALREVTRGDAGRRGAAVPAAQRVSVHAVGRGAGRLGRARDARRQLHDAESAVRRGDHLQRRRGPAGRTRSSCSTSRTATGAGAADRPGQDAGLHRTTWNLRADRAGGGRRQPRRRRRSRARGARCRPAQAARRPQRRRAAARARWRRPQAASGRRPAAAAAAAGTPSSRAAIAPSLGKLVGETFTPIGPAQTFQVMPLPEQNYSSTVGRSNVEPD